MPLARLPVRVDAALRRRLPPYRRWREPAARLDPLLARTDRWSGDEAEAWQLRQLNHLVAHARANVPGHARKFAAAGITTPLRRLADLARLPFLAKDELRAAPEEFQSRGFPRSGLRPVTSGGTTGEPLHFMVDAASYDFVFETWRRAMWARAGYRPGARYVDLTWAFTEEAPVRLGGNDGQLFLSIHALTATDQPIWRDRVRAWKPQFIVGFPSTATAFAKLLPPPDALAGVRGILLASETLSSLQRQELAATFPSARIFSWYGMSELAGFASGCEQSDAFHHWPQSGVLELIQDNGSPAGQPGDSGEIVLTGFGNHATPFIRYRTGDRATLGPSCPHCGRPGIVLASIDGRTDDYLLGRHGRRVPLSALNFHTDEFRRVFAHQFVQDEPGSVVLKLVTLAGFGRGDVTAIGNLVADRLGEDLSLTLEYVDALPRTARGKQMLIVRRCGDGAVRQPAP